MNQTFSSLSDNSAYKTLNITLSFKSNWSLHLFRELKDKGTFPRHQKSIMLPFKNREEDRTSPPYPITFNVTYRPAFLKVRSETKCNRPPREHIRPSESQAHLPPCLVHWTFWSWTPDIRMLKRASPVVPPLKLWEQSEKTLQTVPPCKEVPVPTTRGTGRKRAGKTPHSAFQFLLQKPVTLGPRTPVLSREFPRRREPMRWRARRCSQGSEAESKTTHHRCLSSGKLLTLVAS